jgi:hypothetical protein|tara:strand:- start:1002 stop:1508 length:507 start_codon:yes stop_codon:yes gene_type:complete
MCKDKYILRMTNTVIGNEAADLNADKNAVSIRLPAHLRNKGKCNIKVISIHIALQNATANRVVANGVNLICIRSNIPNLGHSNENNAFNQILGEAVIPADTTRAVSIDATEALEFTCGALPDVIELERMCYDHANNFNLIAAKNYTTAVVPFQVVLEITFDSDENRHN